MGARSAASELVRFAAVGALAFFVDSGALYAAVWAGAGLYVARVFSFLCAATFTWVLNRRFTFNAQTRPSTREWLEYLGANMTGALANFGVYALLVASVPLAARNPVIAVAAGSIAGLAINFVRSRRIAANFRNRDA
jgi:putative flippase GtrA